MSGELATQTPPWPTAIPEGMFSPSAKTVNLSALPSPSVSSRTLTRSRPGPGRRRGYSRLSVIQMRPRSSKVIATGLTMSGSAATTSTWKPAGRSSPGSPRPASAAGWAPGPGRAGSTRRFGRSWAKAGVAGRADPARPARSTIAASNRPLRDSSSLLRRCRLRSIRYRRPSSGDRPVRQGEPSGRGCLAARTARGRGMAGRPAGRRGAAAGRWARPA